MGQKSILLAWLGVGMAAGCGGGQGASSTGSASHTTNSGGLAFTYFGQPKPLFSTSSGSVSVLGQAGATFSNVTLEPPPNLNSTYLVISRGIGTDIELYKSSYASLGTEQLLFQSNGLDTEPGISPYGLINFTKVVGGNSQIYSVRSDGTGLTPINFTDATNPSNGRFSTDGTNRLTFVGENNLFIGSTAGGSASLIQTNELVGGRSCWSPSGTSLAYCVGVGTSGNNDIYSTPTVGGAITDITPTGLQNGTTLYPMAWSPDGVTMLATLRQTSDTNLLITFSVTDPTRLDTITPSNASDSDACFSPDGSMIAIERQYSNSTPSGVYVSDTAGLNQTLVYPDPPGSSSIGGISWSPFLPKETVVAASGSTFYHQASSGFLLTENGSQFGSFVAFTAATPSSAAIQVPTTISASAPLIFTVTADSITSIGYINSYFSTGTTVTLTSTPTVVVSVDSVTGQVDLVAPAIAAKPAVTKNADGTVTYTSAFKAIYDSNGKNLAPSGASQLVLNPKTGRLVSFS